MNDLLIRQTSFRLQSSTKQDLVVRSKLPLQANPKGIVLIIPGMAEHAGRYDDFAIFLAENHFGVYACDHPGHGKSIPSPAEAGTFPAKRGWQIMLENVRALYTYIRKNQPEIPVFIFGHSMGSIIARHFTALYPVYIQGLVLSGSFIMDPRVLNMALLFMNIKILFEGADHKSKWFNRTFYRAFNRHFKNSPTLFEWISSSREEVDEYVADPLCGFDCSNAFYLSLLKGIASTNLAEQLLTYRKTLPVLILSGHEDPVGNFGKDAVKIHKKYYEQNFQNLSLKIFPGRHELLHEKNKDAIYKFLLDWLLASLEIK